MAKFNWAGAAVGLLGGVAAEAKAHEKRLQDLEDQRIADARETRRQEALLAKQMAMAKFQANLQSERDDVNWKRTSTAKIGEEERDDKRWKDRFNMQQEGARQNMEAAHGYNVDLQKLKNEADAQKAGALRQNYNDLIQIGFSEEEAKELVVKSSSNQMTDKDRASLYDKAFRGALALMEPETDTRGQLLPGAQDEVERRAREYAEGVLAKFTPFAESGKGELQMGLLAGAAQGMATERKTKQRKPLSSFRK